MFATQILFSFLKFTSIMVCFYIEVGIYEAKGPLLPIRHLEVELHHVKYIGYDMKFLWMIVFIIQEE